MTPPPMIMMCCPDMLNPTIHELYAPQSARQMAINLTRTQPKKYCVPPVRRKFPNIYYLATSELSSITIFQCKKWNFLDGSQLWSNAPESASQLAMS